MSEWELDRAVGEALRYGDSTLKERALTGLAPHLSNATLTAACAMCSLGRITSATSLRWRRG